MTGGGWVRSIPSHPDEVGTATEGRTAAAAAGDKMNVCGGGGVEHGDEHVVGDTETDTDIPPWGNGLITVSTREVFRPIIAAAPPPPADAIRGAAEAELRFRTRRVAFLRRSWTVAVVW
jgi:hypothetical protein